MANHGQKSLEGRISWVASLLLSLCSEDGSAFMLGVASTAYVSCKVVKSKAATGIHGKTLMNPVGGVEKRI